MNNEKNKLFIIQRFPLIIKQLIYYSKILLYYRIFNFKKARSDNFCVKIMKYKYTF